MSAAQEWMAPADSATPSRGLALVSDGNDSSRLVRAVATLAVSCFLTAVVLVICAAVVSRWG